MNGLFQNYCDPENPSWAPGWTVRPDGQYQFNNNNCSMSYDREPSPRASSSKGRARLRLQHMYHTAPIPQHQQHFQDDGFYGGEQPFQPQPQKKKRKFRYQPPAGRQQIAPPPQRGLTRRAKPMNQFEQNKQQNKWNPPRSVFDRLDVPPPQPLMMNMNYAPDWHAPPLWSPFHQDDYHFPDQHAGGSWHGEQAARWQDRPTVTTRYYRRTAKGDPPLRPGLRAFCTYETDRQRSSKKLQAKGHKLQFVYKIKACLWHKTKMGLHKKKTRIGSIAYRQRLYRQVFNNNMFCRKSHCQYFTRNAEKPDVSLEAYDTPDLEECRTDEYVSLVALCTPTSWQEPRHAYFRHLEYQLFVLDPAGLELASLQHQMNDSNFRILSAARLQNLYLFGAYLSQKEQMQAGSMLLAEVVRFFCVKSDHLKLLCKHGFDSRHLTDDLDAYPTPKEAHAHRPETEEDVYMVAARVIVLPVELDRSENDVYPEYILNYNYLNPPKQ
ncbi:uncharacterized protein LOC135943043 [Cloeon dipterum]|uniref:uncharacterized protein LOC135943043 n=1 Tax=Cloeon dipterum TaxID=197152 RepID=UPI00321FC57D